MVKILCMNVVGMAKFNQIKAEFFIWDVISAESLCSHSVPTV